MVVVVAVAVAVTVAVVVALLWSFSSSCRTDDTARTQTMHDAPTTSRAQVGDSTTCVHLS